jgi:hypothetical protein
VAVRFGIGAFLLRHRTGSLSSELEALWGRVDPVSGFIEGATQQSLHHSLRVEDNVGVLLASAGALKHLSPESCYVVSAAAALHDLDKIRGVGDGLPHGEGSAHAIDAVRDQLFPNRTIARVVEDIVSVHASGDVDKLEEFVTVGHPPAIPLRGLAAVFRLADMLDATEDRVPHLLKDLGARLPAASGGKWSGRNIDGWNIERDNQLVVFTCRTDDPDEAEAAKTAIEMMEKELTAGQRRVLHGFDIPKLTSRGNKYVHKRFPTSINIVFQLPDVRRRELRLTSEDTPLRPRVTAVRREIQLAEGECRVQEHIVLQSDRPGAITTHLRSIDFNRVPLDKHATIDTYGSFPSSLEAIQLEVRCEDSPLPVVFRSGGRGAMRFEVAFPTDEFTRFSDPPRPITYDCSYVVPEDLFYPSCAWLVDAPTTELVLCLRRGAAAAITVSAYKRTPTGETIPAGVPLSEAREGDWIVTTWKVGNPELNCTYELTWDGGPATTGVTELVRGTVEELVPKPGQAMNPVEQAAAEYLANLNVLKFTTEAKAAAFSYFVQQDHPEAVASRSAGTTLNLQLAAQNAVEVLRRAEAIARGGGLTEVDEQCVQLAIHGLCPGLYPFC